MNIKTVSGLVAGGVIAASLFGHFGIKSIDAHPDRAAVEELIMAHFRGDYSAGSYVKARAKMHPDTTLFTFFERIEVEPTESDCLVAKDDLMNPIYDCYTSLKVHGPQVVVDLAERNGGARIVTRWRANRLGGQTVFVGFP